MNVLLWILQILLALWNVIGGIYTATNFDKIKSTMAGDLPAFAWVIIGIVQVLFALCLVFPGAFGIFPKLTSISAVYLALNALAGCLLFAQYAGFPGMLWGVIPALFAGFVAYQRYSA